MLKRAPPLLFKDALKRDARRLVRLHTFTPPELFSLRMTKANRNFQPRSQGPLPTRPNPPPNLPLSLWGTSRKGPWERGWEHKYGKSARGTMGKIQWLVLPVPPISFFQNLPFFARPN